MTFENKKKIKISFLWLLVLKLRRLIAKIIYVVVVYYALHITLSFVMINKEYFLETWDYVYVVSTKTILYSYLFFIFLVAKRMKKNQIIKAWHSIAILIAYGLMWLFMFLQSIMTKPGKILAESFLSDIPYIYNIAVLFLIRFIPIYCIIDKLFVREKFLEKARG